jgi:hypothetical protein
MAINSQRRLVMLVSLLAPMSGHGKDTKILVGIDIEHKYEVCVVQL